MSAKPKRAMGLGAKLLGLLLAVSLAPLAVIIYFAVTTPVEVFKTSTLERLAAVAQAKSTAVDQFTNDRKRDVERMATLISAPFRELQRANAQFESLEKKPPTPETLPGLEDAEALGNKKPKENNKADDSTEEDGLSAAERSPDPLVRAVAENRTALKSTLNLILWDQAQFEELIVLDNEGRVVASTFEGHEDHTAARLEYFQMGRKVTYVQSIFWSPITESLTTMIATPIRLGPENLGVLAARLNLKQFFQLINDSTGLGVTGETVVGKKVEGKVQFMAPTRHDINAALRRTLPLGEPRYPLVEAATGQTGAGVHHDYRGKRVLAAWRYVPSLEWGLVAKIDYDEAMSGVADFRTRALFLAAFVVVVVVFVSALTARALVEPLRHLRFAADQVSRGDLNVELNITSKDEIGDLADSFERMVAAIKFFRAHSRSPDEEDPPESPEPPELTTGS